LAVFIFTVIITSYDYYCCCYYYNDLHPSPFSFELSHHFQRCFEFDQFKDY